jgi:hypothetical protein
MENTVVADSDFLAFNHCIFAFEFAYRSCAPITESQMTFYAVYAQFEAFLY